MITIALVDDDHLVRSGIRMVVDSADDMTVVAEAADGQAGVHEIDRVRPDVALVDVRMPVLDGIEATRRVSGGPASTRVIILTTFEHDEYVFDSLRAGASGFLLKRTPPEDLLAAIRVVAAGEALLAPSVTRRLIQAYVRTPAAPAVDPVLDTLTDREREVLAALASGATNTELAAQLFIGEETVRTHVKRVLQKLGLRDRVQAVVYAYEHGVVRPGGAGE